MKKFIFTSMMVFLSFLMNAQPPQGQANKGETYGEKITAAGAVSLGDLDKSLKKNGTFKGKVTGVVKEACSKKGCWMVMELPDKTKMQVKFKDYGFFVPAAIVGKTVVLKEAHNKRFSR